MQTLLPQLESLLQQADISLSDQQKQQLLALVGLLHKWNKAYNLTSVREPEAMLVRHILDSIVVAPYLHGARFIDVGTGPGLPGLPLAIVQPDKQFVLLDSLGKRIRFIRQVIMELGLKNVVAVQARVEDFHDEQGFDGVLSRAFASLTDMLNWCHHLPAPQGVFLALKGLYPQDELATLPAGFTLVTSHRLDVPQLDAERHLIIVKKQL